MTQLNNVIPTALEARDQRRKAMQILREIDTLLRDEHEVSSDATNAFSGFVHSKFQGKCKVKNKLNPQSDSTHGPGTCRFNAALVQRHSVFAARCSTSSSRNQKKILSNLWKRSKTPGPGSYGFELADSITKPRVLMQSFSKTKLCCRCPPCTCKTKENEDMIDNSSVSATAYKSVPSITSTFAANVKTFVTYMPPTKANYRTYAQKKKIRALLVSRKRSRTSGNIGFYNINYFWTEKRLGTTTLVPMARHSGKTKHRKPKTAVELRKKIRAWNIHQENTNYEILDNDLNGQPTSKRHGGIIWRKANSSIHTNQWRRAQAMRLMREKELKQRYIYQQQRFLQSSVDPICQTKRRQPMTKQLGRDKAIVRGKNMKIFTKFAAPMRKAPPLASKHEKEDSRVDLKARSSRQQRSGGPLVSFAKTLGRRDVPLINKCGVYLLKGGNLDLSNYSQTLKLYPTDAMVQPRVPVCVMGHQARFPTQSPDTRSKLAPNYSLIEKSVVGHRYVSFRSQLERPTIVKQDSKAEELILHSEAAQARVKISASKKIVDYTTMTGREEPRISETLERLNPNYDLKWKRVPQVVDMAKATSRTIANVHAIESEKDGVLCKLAANHEELEKALNLLSKYKRLDVGHVEMTKMSAPRFDKMTSINRRGLDDPTRPADLSML